MDRGPEDLDTPGHAAGSGAVSGAHASGDPGSGAAAHPGPSGGGPAAPDGAGKARLVQLVAGDLLVTVNPVDGSEIEPCPPARRPAFPTRRTPEERAARESAARPPVPSGSAPHRPPLAGRQEIRGRLARLLSRGRSLRLIGPGGSGRTTLLDGIAEDCAHLAPDGVIRLSGHRRTVRDLLYDLFRTVYATDLYRPDDTLIRRLVADIGAVVLLDDLEFGGQALEELLDATPECAFALVATPDVPAPAPESHLEEIVLDGLDRADGMDLLRAAAGRELTAQERSWAADLWSGSEAWPACCVQAGALLRYRAEPRAGRDAGAAGAAEPLPSLAGGAAPVVPLAALLSTPARTLLQFAVVLGGELPQPAQLPALISDPHADAAPLELLTAGLLTPVGARYRLAAGVKAQLEAAGFADRAAERARAAGEHYVWWTGHRSVGPERVLAESDTVLAVLAALAPVTTPASGPEAERSLAVQLARSAAPAFAEGVDWGVWERALRYGQEAARRAGEVAEEAYFHHELGVLALCTGRLDQARAELGASIGLRGVLADRHGGVLGRRALALAEDRAAAASGGDDGPDGTDGSRSDDDPGAPGGPSGGVQTSFGAGVPFLAPEDPPTTELRAISGDLGTPAAPPGTPPSGTPVPSQPPGGAAGTGGGRWPGLAGPPGPGAGTGAHGAYGTEGGGHQKPGRQEFGDQQSGGRKPGNLADGFAGHGRHAEPGAYPEHEEPGDHGTHLDRGASGDGGDRGAPGGHRAYRDLQGPAVGQDPVGPSSRVPGPGPADEASAARSDVRRGAARNTKRNLVAAAGGTLLAAVLGTVVTLGTTSDHGAPSDTVDPDPSMSQHDDADGTVEQPARHPDSSSSRSPSSSSGSPGTAEGSGSPSGTTGTPGGAHAPATSDRPTHGSTTGQGTHRPPTHRPPTSKPPTSEPPTSSPPPESSGSPTQEPGPPETSDSVSDVASSLIPSRSRS